MRFYKIASFRSELMVLALLPTILAFALSAISTNMKAKTTGGTGLGLSTVLSIVQRNHGIVDVESVLGEGATLHITLRAADSAEVCTVRDRARIPAGNGEEILIVDDKEAILEITRTILENANYNASAASDGVQALCIFQTSSQKWKLVITDASMRWLYVRTKFIAWLQKYLSCSLPVIVFSSDSLH